MTSKEFWGYVDEEKGRLIEGHKERLAKFGKSRQESAFEGQPRDGKSVFLISKKNLDRGTTPGQVSEAQMRLAAQCIVEQTHEVATAAQIEKFLAERIAEREQVMQTEQHRRAQFVVNVTPGQSVGLPGAAAAHDKRE
jgi:hypothetical protein